MSRKLPLYAALVTILAFMLYSSAGVHQAEAQVTFYIRADGSIDPPTAPISTLDNITYSFTGNISNPIVIERDNITIDGSGYTLQGAGTENGFNLTERHDVTVKKTIIDNFDMGIYVRDSSKIVVMQNEVQNSASTGIYLSRSSNCSVVDNALVNDYRGLGIYLVSSNHTISGNLIKDNSQCGVRGANAGNRYYGNNFQNNTAHVLFQNNYFDDVWDNGLEGNYWDNYTGVDLDGDGIGESSHRIDANNRDYYPLMGMFSSFEATSEHRVEIVSNSTLSDFQFNSTALSFTVTGANATRGFSRIHIPTVLISGPYKVFVNSMEISYTTLPISNATDSYLYFTYDHSSQEIVVIPESLTLLFLPLFVMATLFGFLVLKRESLR